MIFAVLDPSPLSVKLQYVEDCSIDNIEALDCL